jgi:RimJ/RimL family protein N-acetyltransferase
MKTIDLRDFEEHFSTYLTDRVAIRPLSPSDMWPLWLATRSPDFNRFLLWDRPGNVRQIHERLDRIADQRRLGAIAAVSGVIRATGEWMCALRVYPIDTPEYVTGTAVEGGIWLHPKFWKSGAAVELTKLTIDAVFGASEIGMFRACAAAGNKSSLAMLKASGFVPVRESVVDKEDGTPSPTVELEILREHWKPWFDQSAAYAHLDYQDIETASSAISA